MEFPLASPLDMSKEISLNSINYVTNYFVIIFRFLPSPPPPQMTRRHEMATTMLTMTTWKSTNWTTGQTLRLIDKGRHNKLIQKKKRDTLPGSLQVLKVFFKLFYIFTYVLNPSFDTHVSYTSTSFYYHTSSRRVYLFFSSLAYNVRVFPNVEWSESQPFDFMPRKEIFEKIESSILA